MKIADIKAKAPSAETIEINPNYRYLVLVKTCPEEEFDHEAADLTVEEITKLIGVGNCLVYFVEDPSEVRLIEITPDTTS